MDYPIEAYFAQREGEALSMGVLVPDQILTMARKMAEVPRFRDMRLTGFRSILDKELEIQFAALTIDLGDGSLYLSFRGTDDTLVGWKEDFNMTFLPTVPSQKASAAVRGARVWSDSRQRSLETWMASAMARKMEGVLPPATSLPSPTRSPASR